MVQKKFEITLPDETQLIAEAAEGSNCPCINIYRRDNEGETDAVAFAEYNPDREYGRKLMVGAYQNNDDETRYYKNFCYVLNRHLQSYMTYTRPQKAMNLRLCVMIILSRLSEIMTGS